MRFQLRAIYLWMVVMRQARHGYDYGIGMAARDSSQREENEEENTAHSLGYHSRWQLPQ